MRTQHKIDKHQIVMGAKGTPLNSFVYPFDTSFVSAPHLPDFANKIELAAMTLYISMLGLKCSKCSCEKYVVISIQNVLNKIYVAKCLKCGQKISVDVILDKEKVPKRKAAAECPSSRLNQKGREKRPRKFFPRKK